MCFGRCHCCGNVKDFYTNTHVYIVSVKDFLLKQSFRFFLFQQI